MNTKKVIKFAQLCKSSRAQSEADLHFLSELFVKTEDHWDVIEYYVPVAINVDRILESINQFWKATYKDPYLVDYKAIPNLILSEVKLMSLIPLRQHDLFMLFPTLIKHFDPENSSWDIFPHRDEVGKQVVRFSYGAMISILKHPENPERWEFKVNDELKSSELSASISLSTEEQLQLIAAFKLIRDIQGEDSIFTLARWLVRAEAVRDKAISLYRKEIGDKYKDYFDCPAAYGNWERFNPLTDLTLNAFAQAKISQVRAIAVLDKHLASPID